MRLFHRSAVLQTVPYDDKVLITFNYKEGTQTITFEEAAQAASKGNGSDLDCIPALEKLSTMC